MKRLRYSTGKMFAAAALAAALGWAASAQGNVLVSFPFNEGSGARVTDAAQNLEGFFGFRLDPAVDTATLTPNAPSGLPGDNCLTTAGGGFAMVDDASSPILAITNGPITIECWLYIDPFSPVKTSEGIVGYGNSYKMGLIGGRQVFTLFGVADITNSAAGIPAGQWTHLAAAWEPGVGVHFYVNGSYTMVSHTAMAARPPFHNYLSIGAESQMNNVVGSLDRVRVHNALLTIDDLDFDAANPKAPLANTLVAYNFNENSFPCQSSVAPARPAVPAYEITQTIGAPSWITDTPTGLPGDFALSFNGNLGFFRDRVSVKYEGEAIPLGANNTNYTLEAWIKLPPSDGLEDRRVIFRGPTNAPRASLSIHTTRTMHTTLFGNKDFDSPVVIPNDNRWHHVAVVMEDFSRMKFYLDGIHRFTTNRTATGAVNAHAGSPNLLIGQESDTRYFRGSLDRVRIHNAALTAEQLDFPAVPGQAIVTAHPVDAIADAGGSATFSATVNSSSAATYQWYHRANRTDLQGTPVPGATSTTLNLSNLTPASQGFYYLRISNSAGVSESYGARLLVRAGAYYTAGGFEAPKYTAGPIEDQDFWLQDQNGNVARVLTASQIEAALSAAGLSPAQPVRSGSQAVLFSGTGIATATVRPLAGFENEKQVTVEAWMRPLVRGTSTLVTNNTFFTVENAAGTRAAAVRFGPSASIDYNSGNLWVATGLKWDETGSTWYRVTLRLDYTTKTHDVLIDGVKVNANPLPFYAAGSDSLRQVRVYRGSGQAGMIMDDLTVSGQLRVSNISLSGVNVNISWEGGFPPFQLQRRSSISGGDWENVGSPTTANEATDTTGATSMFYRVISN